MTSTAAFPQDYKGLFGTSLQSLLIIAQREGVKASRKMRASDVRDAIAAKRAEARA